MNTSTMSEEESIEESLEKHDSAKPANDEPESYQEDNKMEEIFPWQAKFNELCRAAVGSKSMKMLENLLTVYLQKISKTVQDCYMKPNRAGKLKKCMSDAFVFFHLFYQDIKESFENSTYLEKMTELMAMYMDIEIKASRRRREHAKKVVSRLTSALHIFLDHSENHILDVIIRAKFINKNYREVTSPVLGKLLTTLRVYPMNDTLYVRYLLAFKLWKKVVADTEERKNINKLAIQNLPAPSNFMERYKRFNNVLPRVPNSMNVTTFYMQAKFNLKTACQAFMKISKDPQQPIISDKPLFFEGRLGSSQSTFSGKISSFECGVSRNLMNDIWSIAEPATTPKKGDAKGDNAGKKKSKDKPNKNVKKKTKDWFDREKKKNNKNKGITLGKVKENNLPTTVMPPSESVSNPIAVPAPLPAPLPAPIPAPIPAPVPTSVPAAVSAPVPAPVLAKEPAARELIVDVKPNIVTTEVISSVTTEVKAATVGATPTPVIPSVQLQEATVETCISSFQELPFASQASPAETKPSVDLLTPIVKPEVPNVPSPATEDTKPLALIVNALEMPPGLPIQVPRILLSPPVEAVAKKEAPALNGYGVSCRQFTNSIAACSNFFSGQREEETTTKPPPGVVEEPVSTAISQVVEITETVKPRDLNELMEVKSLPNEVVSPIVVAEFLDHEQDVLNEVTIATSELDISAGENDGELPVYLQCQKEVVVETAEQPSPVGSVDSSKIEEENLSGIAEVQSVIIPSNSGAQPKSCYVPPSHSSEVEQLVTEQRLVNRDNFKFLIPSPPDIVREQPVYVEPREVVKPEMGPPPDDLSLSKEAPPMDEDWGSLPFNLFQPTNNSDILFECMGMERGFDLDSVLTPHVIDPRMMDNGPSIIKRRASEEFSQYSQMCLESNLHGTRVENLLPPQEFLADEFSPFTATPDQYYYNARDLYGNYNTNPFFEEPVNQTRGSSNQKPVQTNGLESDGPSYGTVDYSSTCSSLNSANNSILLPRDKDNLTRHSRGMRVPSNSDNNYYRETDSHKTQDEQVLRKTEEPVVNAKSSVIKQPNSYTSPVVDDRHSLQKSVSNNPHRKTPHPVSGLQDNRRNVGYASNSGGNSTVVDCKVQLPHLRSEDATPTPKPTFRGGVSSTRRSTRSNPKKRASSPCRSTSPAGKSVGKADVFFGGGGDDWTGSCDFDLQMYIDQTVDESDADQNDVDFHPAQGQLKKLKVDINKRPVTRRVSKETNLILNPPMPITLRRKSRKPR